MNLTLNLIIRYCPWIKKQDQTIIYATCKKVISDVCFQEEVDRGPTRASMKMYVVLVRAVIYYGCSSHVAASLL